MRTVLIADDEASQRLLVSTTVESDGYTVVEAEDGDAAWSVLQRERPALALLDIQMPGWTGLELLQKLRADPLLAGTKVVLLSARAQQADVAAGLCAGADFYLTKPFSPLELLSVVEQALARA